MQVFRLYFFYAAQVSNYYRHITPEAARAFDEYVGGREAQILAARDVFRLPARTDLPEAEVPTWVADVMHEMRVATMDWELLARDGSGWMAYWDQHVRGSGRRQ